MLINTNTAPPATTILEGYYEQHCIISCHHYNSCHSEMKTTLIGLKGEGRTIEIIKNEMAVLKGEIEAMNEMNVMKEENKKVIDLFQTKRQTLSRTLLDGHGEAIDRRATIENLRDHIREHVRDVENPLLDELKALLILDQKFLNMFDEYKFQEDEYNKLIKHELSHPRVKMLRDYSQLQDELIALLQCELTNQT